MPKILPFKALRPQPDHAQLVSSKSWDSNHNHISKSIMENYDHSYLHVVKPHLNFTDLDRIPDKHYPFARQKFLDMKTLEVLVKEEEASFYLYQLTDLKLNIRYIGIVGLASVDDYLKGNIKVHENTLSKKEEALVKHVDYVKAVGEPVLLTFEGGTWYDDLVNSIESKAPLFDFVGDEAVHTEIWPIADTKHQQTIQEHMEALPAFYIADGHHRSAGAVRYCKQQREQNPNYTGNESFNYFLSFFIPTNKLKIFEFNRLVKDLRGMSKLEFFDALDQYFKVREIGHATLEIEKKNHLFGMYIENIWYGLDLKEGVDIGVSVLDKLDVSILENLILKNILHIQDSKSDERLSYVDGTKGIHRLQELVDIGEFQVAFSLYPTLIEEVIEVADQKMIMPPKSTWFEPKLRTGLLIYELD